MSKSSGQFPFCLPVVLEMALSIEITFINICVHLSWNPSNSYSLLYLIHLPEYDWKGISIWLSPYQRNQIVIIYNMHANISKQILFMSMESVLTLKSRWAARTRASASKCSRPFNFATLLLAFLNLHLLHLINVGITYTPLFRLKKKKQRLCVCKDYV